MAVSIIGAQPAVNQSIPNLSAEAAREIVLCHEDVKKCEVYLFADNIIVAIRTEPIFFHSENERLVRDIREELESFPNVRRVYITQDVSLYCELKKLNEQRQPKEKDLIKSVERIIKQIPYP